MGILRILAKNYIVFYFNKFSITILNKNVNLESNLFRKQRKLFSILHKISLKILP